MTSPGILKLAAVQAADLVVLRGYSPREAGRRIAERLGLPADDLSPHLEQLLPKLAVEALAKLCRSLPTLSIARLQITIQECEARLAIIDKLAEDDPMRSARPAYVDTMAAATEELRRRRRR